MMSPEAQTLRRAYKREWARKNPDKIQKYQESFYEKKAACDSVKKEKNMTDLVWHTKQKVLPPPPRRPKGDIRLTVSRGDRTREKPNKIRFYFVGPGSQTLSNFGFITFAIDEDHGRIYFKEADDSGFSITRSVDKKTGKINYPTFGCTYNDAYRFLDYNGSYELLLDPVRKLTYIDLSRKL